MGRSPIGSIDKVGKNSYRLRRYIDGKRITIKVITARNKSEARNILNKYLSKNLNDIERGNITLKQFSKNFMESKKIELGISTYDDYLNMVTKHIIPYFNERKLNQIYSGDITKFRGYLAQKKGKSGCLSNRTINKVLIFLHGIFQDAVDDDRILKNPVKLKKHKLDTESKNDFFTIEEMNLFLSKVTHEYVPFFFVAWHTAMRLGELVGLKWEDIDWGKRTIRIKRSIYQRKGHVEKSPKTKSGNRTVYLTPTCQLILHAHKAKSKVHSIKGYVFERNGNPFRKDGIVRSQMRQARRKAGLRDTLTFNSIRHGLITLMRGKFPDHIVKKWVGHSTNRYNVTDIYTHTTDEEIKQYADMLDELLNSKSNLETLKYAVQ
jgi:integrase